MRREAQASWGPLMFADKRLWKQPGKDSLEFLVRGSLFFVLSRFVALGGISQAQGSWLGEKVEG